MQGGSIVSHEDSIILNIPYAVFKKMTRHAKKARKHDQTQEQNMDRRNRFTENLHIGVN